MKKIMLLFAASIMMLACTNKELVINGNFTGTYPTPDEITIIYQYEDNDLVKTIEAVVNNGHFEIKCPVVSQQLATLNIIGIGTQPIALESGKLNIHFELNEIGEVTDFNIEGTINNEFINVFDNYYKELSNLEQTITNEEELEIKEQKVFDEIYQTLKGDVNSLVNINTMAGWYGYSQYFWVFSFDQCDTLCSMMNGKTLQNSRMKYLYDIFQTQKGTAVGYPYKDISALTPADELLSLSDIVGKTDYVLVDFWASWCGPCRQSMPAVKELYDSHRDQLQILGVSLDNNDEAWKGAIESLGLNWLHISDLQGWSAQGAKEYGVNSIPATVLIDKDGIIVGRNLSISEINKILEK